MRFVVALMFGCAVAQDAPVVLEHRPEGLPDWGFLTAEIAVDSYDNLQEWMDKREPVVFKDSPAKMWAALENWKDPHYLQDHIAQVKTIVSSTANNIYLAPKRLLNTLNYEDHQRAQFDKSLQKKSEINMTIPSLIRGMRQSDGSPDKPYLFAHSDLTPYEETLGADLEPRWAVWANDTHVHGARENQPRVHLWVGKHGTVSGTHYDTFTNLHVQITGKKRFFLANTDQWNKISLFPYLHPHSRHSQYEVEGLRRSYPTDIEDKVAFSYVDLSPGEMIMIPPHWFHRVLPLENKENPDELSVSVNGWSVSPEALFADYLLDVRVPKVFQDADSDHHTKAVAFRLLAVELVKRVKAVMHEQAVEWLENLFMQRYHGPVAKALKCDQAQWSTRVCANEDTKLEDKLYNDVGRSINLLYGAFKQGRFVSMIRNEVLDMQIADYIERIAEYVFGYPMACHQIRCLGFLDHNVCSAEY